MPPWTRQHAGAAPAVVRVLGRAGVVRVKKLGQATVVLASDTGGHVLEQRKREVERAMDAVPGG